MGFLFWKMISINKNKKPEPVLVCWTSPSTGEERRSSRKCTYCRAWRETGWRMKELLLDEEPSSNNETSRSGDVGGRWSKENRSWTVKEEESAAMNDSGKWWPQPNANARVFFFFERGGGYCSTDAKVCIWEKEKKGSCMVRTQDLKFNLRHVYPLGYGLTYVEV